MTDSKLENGYTGIPNMLLEALMQTKVPGREFRLLLGIFRKTFGWNKDDDWISISQLSQMTGIGKTHINEVMNKLVNKNIVSKRKSGYKAIYSIQTDISKWVLPKQIKIITENGNKLPPKKVITKYINKRRYLKFVELTDKEYQELSSQLGEEKTKEMIERLNNYIGSTGKNYLSHYFTILSWINKEKRENKDEEIFRA